MTSHRGAKERSSKHKSRNVANSSDPRAAKTRDQIASAFLQLISRRAYYRIRVSDITRKAKVGRATFYAHFSSKDALLQDRFGYVVQRMVLEVKDDPCVVDCTALFAHLLSAGAIYRSLTAGPGRAQIERILQDVLEARITELVTSRAARESDRVSTPGFVPRFVAGTVMSLIAWALEQPTPPSAEDQQSAFKALVGGALGRS